MLLQDTPRTLRCSKNPCAFCYAASFCTKDNSLNRGPLIPSCSYAFQNTWKYYPIFRVSSSNYCSAITCLLELWMISICVAIFISILRHLHFDPIDSTCVWRHTIISDPSISFWLRRHFEHELVLDQSFCHQLCPRSILPIPPWSERLLLILRLGNHNSFVI